MVGFRFDTAKYIYYGEEAPVLINPTPQAFPYELEGQRNLAADGDRAGEEVLAQETGNIQVEGRTLRVYI